MNQEHEHQGATFSSLNRRNAGQFGGMSFVEFTQLHQPDPAPEAPEPPPPAAPESLATLVATYKALVEEEEAANSKRDRLAGAHLQATNLQHAAATALEEAREALQDALCTPGEAAAEKALTAARNDLAKKTERVAMLAGALKSHPGGSNGPQIRIAMDAIYRRLSQLELDRLPEEVCNILRGSYAAAVQAGSDLEWGEFLASVIPPLAGRGEFGAVLNEVLSAHGVEL